MRIVLMFVFLFLCVSACTCVYAFSLFIASVFKLNIILVVGAAVFGKDSSIPFFYVLQILLKFSLSQKNTLHSLVNENHRRFVRPKSGEIGNLFALPTRDLPKMQMSRRITWVDAG